MFHYIGLGYFRKQPCESQIKKTDISITPPFLYPDAMPLPSVLVNAKIIAKTYFCTPSSSIEDKF